MRKLVVIFLLLCAGCRTVNPPLYPSGMEAICEESRERARVLLLAAGYQPRTTHARVSLHPGERFMQGMWAWQSGSIMVGGSYSRFHNRIEVGCNPVTGGDVAPGVLLHEMGQSLGPSNHPKGLEPLFGFHD